MNDELAAGPADSDAPLTVAVEAPPAPPPTSFGARLNWERERLGLTVTDVAARLRLHPNQVRAIEQESLAKLPEAAYVRGFVRSYARVLNLDPAPLLADLGLKLTSAADSVVDGMVQARDYSPVRAAAREHASRKIVMAGAVLLLIALGALGWYATHPPRPEAPSTVTSVPTTPPPSSTPAPGSGGRFDRHRRDGSNRSPGACRSKLGHGSCDGGHGVADNAGSTGPAPEDSLCRPVVGRGQGCRRESAAVTTQRGRRRARDRRHAAVLRRHR